MTVSCAPLTASSLLALSGARPSAPLAPAEKPSLLRRAVRCVDEYTSPRPGTAGNFDSPSFFQAAFNGAGDGFYLFGTLGLAAGAGAATVGIAMHKWTGSQAAGVITGALAGAGAGVAIGLQSTLGTAGWVASAAGGALLGAYEVLRGDPTAHHRDSTTLVSAFFLRGPVKLAASLGSMVGDHCESTVGKALVAGGVGAVVGAAIATAIPGGVGVGLAAAISGVAAAVGPFLGPRQSQFLRNLSMDVGKGLHAIGEKLGMARPESDTPAKPKSKLMAALGTIPVSFAREGLHAFFISDGSLAAVIVGGVKESIRQIQIVLQQKETPEAPKPAAAEKKAAAPTPADEKKAA